MTMLPYLRPWFAYKMRIAAFLMSLVYLPYLVIGNVTFFHVTALKPSVVDGMIPFIDTAVWPYLSIYLFMPIAPMVMINRNLLRHYAMGMASIALLAHLIFLFWPTTVGRPNPTHANVCYQFLAVIDPPLNCFPSLHAALTLYSALCCDMLSRTAKNARLLKTLLWAWTALILLSTLATKQHFWIDVAGGAVLGVVVFVCAFKPIRHLQIRREMIDPTNHQFNQR